MTDTLTRTAADTTVPAAGTYDIDPSHSKRHLPGPPPRPVQGPWRLRRRSPAPSTIAEDPTQSSVEVTLDADSFTTGNDDRDGHVKSADFLDVEQYPSLTFRSTGVRQDGDDWKVDGELTVKDVTRPVTLDVEFEGAGQDPWGNGRIAFAADDRDRPRGLRHHLEPGARDRRRARRQERQDRHRRPGRRPLDRMTRRPRPWNPSRSPS